MKLEYRKKIVSKMAGMMLLLTHAFSILNQWNQAKAGDAIPWQVIKDCTTYNPPEVASDGVTSHAAMPAVLGGSSTTPARTAAITLMSQAGAGQPLKQSVATMSMLPLATTSCSHPTTTTLLLKLQEGVWNLWALHQNHQSAEELPHRWLLHITWRYWLPQQHTLS